MSVLIKGMEMPTNCCQCPVNMEVCKRGYKYLLAHPELYDKRAGDCPIVQVPPHGRLIDADAIVDYVQELKRDAIHAYEWTGKSGEWSARIGERERFAATIEDAPTIIPAEDGKDTNVPSKEEGE